MSIAPCLNACTGDSGWIRKKLPGHKSQKMTGKYN
ncbi:hypothetical protein BN440_1955 [Erwinia amylovora MR1]|nr:hypothetical protein BN440_1955 [Erwinia amylovora MR1]